MYLVHLRLRRADGSPPCALPDAMGAWLRAAARAEDHVEHVVVHGDARPHPVLGVYVIADRIEEAEENAARAWERAQVLHPAFRGWALIEARTPFIASLYEGFLDAPAD